MTQPLVSVHPPVPHDDVPGICKCGMPFSNRVHVSTEQMQARPELVPVPDARVVEGANLHPLSNAAAVRAMSTADTWKGKVFRAILLAGPRGMTDHELLDAREIQGARESSVRPRRAELEDEGVVRALVDAHGQPVTRPTPTGSQATVWVLTEHAETATAPAGRDRSHLTVVPDPAPEVTVEVPTVTDPRLEEAAKFQPPTATGEKGDHRTRVYCQTCTATGRRGYCAPRACYCMHPTCHAYDLSRTLYPGAYPKADAPTVAALRPPPGVRA